MKYVLTFIAGVGAGVLLGETGLVDKLKAKIKGGSKLDNLIVSDEVKEKAEDLKNQVEDLKTQATQEK